MSRYGASTFSSLLKDCVLWAPLQHSAGVSGDIDEFPIIPSGVTVTNNGTFTKTSLGNNRSVFNFDGSTNYISLSDNDAWSFGTGDFTMSFWVRFLNSVGTEYILEQYASSSSRYNVIASNSNGTIMFGRFTGSWDIKVTNTVFSANTWTLLTITRTSGNAYMYVNGILDRTDANTTDYINISGALTVGVHNDSPSLYRLNGNIKDLMIFKGRALTQPEIKLLMNRTHPITGAGLLPGGYDYWRA